MTQHRIQNVHQKFLRTYSLNKMKNLMIFMKMPASNLSQKVTREIRVQKQWKKKVQIPFKPKMKEKKMPRSNKILLAQRAFTVSQQIKNNITIRTGN